MWTMHRVIIETAVASVVLATAGPAQSQQNQQNFPAKPVRLVVGLSPGGTLDTLARILDLPDVKERLQLVGFYIEPATPEEYDRIVRRQIELLSKVARDAGLLAK